MTDPPLSFGALIERIRKDRKEGTLRPEAEYLAYLGEDDRFERRVVEQLLAAMLAAGASGDADSATGLSKSGDTVAFTGRPPPRPADQSQAHDGALMFGAYRVERELGRGGMGVVYLAHDTALCRKVALKVMARQFAEHPRARIRFRREAEVLGRIEHPNICGILAVGEHDDMPWIAMRFVAGRSLAEEIQHPSEALTIGHVTGAGSAGNWHAAVDLVETVARAVHTAHEAGVIHRDLKPGNIMISPDGTPVVVDFGVANDVMADAANLTLSGDVVGTPNYMSPEQIKGDSQRADRTVDVWSLGVILYELLVGKVPFEGASRHVLFQAIVARDPVPIRKLARHLPRDLEVVVGTALEKEPRRRYQTAEELADDLRRVRDIEPIHATPPSTFARVAKFVRRKPALALLILLVVVGGPGLAVLVTSHVMAGRRVDAVVERSLGQARKAIEARQPRKALELLASISELPTDADAIAAVRRAAQRLKLVEGVETLALDATTDPGGRLALAEIASLREQGIDSPRLLTLEVHVLLRNGERRGALERARAAPDRQHGALLAAVIGNRQPSAGTVPLDDSDGALLHALAQSAAGRHRQALDILARVLQRHPEAHGIAWAAAEEAVHIQSLDAALAYAGRARSLSGGFGPRREARYATHLRLAGLKEEALALVRTASVRAPSDRVVRLHLANALAAAGHLDDAEAHLKALTASEPPLFKAFRAYGALLYDRKQWEAAIAMYERALALTEDDADTWLDLGNALCSAKKPVEAERALRRALALRPIFPFACSTLSVVLRDQGRLEEAREAAETALRTKPDFPEARSNYGSILHRLGRIEEAEQEYRKALKKIPGLVQACFNLGLVLRESKPKEATALFRRVLEKDPEDEAALTNLADLLVVAMQFDEALECAEKACEVAPRDVQCWNTLATTRVAAGKTMEAVAPLRKALEIDPDFVAAHFNLLLILQTAEPLEALARGIVFLHLDPSRKDQAASTMRVLQGRCEERSPDHLLVVTLRQVRSDDQGDQTRFDELFEAWRSMEKDVAGSTGRVLKRATGLTLIRLARRWDLRASTTKLDNALKDLQG